MDTLKETIKMYQWVGDVLEKGEHHKYQTLRDVKNHVTVSEEFKWTIAFDIAALEVWGVLMEKRFQDAMEGSNEDMC